MTENLGSSGTASDGQSTASQASDKASEAAGQAQDKAREVAGQAQETAQNLAAQARTRVQSQVDEQSTQAGEKAKSTAGDLRSVSQELRSRGNDPAASVADQAAERVERLGSYLKESDGQRILADVEDFGRRQPLLALAGGVVLGIAAARFLKASSSERYQQRFSSPQSVDVGAGTTASSYGGENPAGPGYGNAPLPPEPAVGTAVR